MTQILCGNSKQVKFLWQQIASPVITEILASTPGIDGVVFDLEHGCFNDETLYTCIQVCSAYTRPIIRLPEIDKARLRMCLDAGVGGVILSTVDNCSQLDILINHCLYSQNRGQGLVRQNNWSATNMKTKRKYVDNNLLIIPQIETISAVNNIDFLKHPRVDYYMVGPYDLSASLGDPGNFESEKYIIAYKRLVDAVGLEKLGLHIVTDVTPELIKKYSCGMLAIGLDTTFLLEGIKRCQIVNTA